MTRAATKKLVCKESFAYSVPGTGTDDNGEPVEVQRTIVVHFGDVVPANDPAVQGREHLFEEQD